MLLVSGVPGREDEGGKRAEDFRIEGRGCLCSVGEDVEALSLAGADAVVVVRSSSMLARWTNESKVEGVKIEKRRSVSVCGVARRGRTREKAAEARPDAQARSTAAQK